jgi:hypothetical protein
MADNVNITAGVGTPVRTDDIGGGIQVQYVKLMNGTDAASDVIPGEATNGLDVDVTRLPALVAGTALVGKVGIDQVTANANEVVIKSGTVTTVTAVTAITNALPAGTNAIGKLASNTGVDIGDVDILSIAAGNNNIGDVDVATLPALVAGTALIGKVGIDQVTANANEVVIKSGTVTTVTAVTAITNALPAGTNLLGKAQPFAAMLEGGLTELVGINEQVDQNDYSGSVEVALGGTYSGEILSVAFYATEDGTGAVQDSAGILYVFDADPSIASGDTAMTAAERVTVLGKLSIGAADWDADTGGGLAYVNTSPIPFHALASLFFVWKHLDATSLNDAAGDDEQLEFNFWYKRES